MHTASYRVFVLMPVICMSSHSQCASCGSAMLLLLEVLLLLLLPLLLRCVYMCDVHTASATATVSRYTSLVSHNLFSLHVDTYANCVLLL
jgi:hypothetical protein